MHGPKKNPHALD